MEQYYLIASIEKREYLNPHSINHQAKLQEIDYFHSIISLIVTKLLQTRWFNSTIVTVGNYYNSLHLDLACFLKNNHNQRKTTWALRLFLENMPNLANPDFNFYDYVTENFKNVTKIPEVKEEISKIIRKRDLLGLIPSPVDFLNQAFLLFKDCYFVNFTQKTFIDLYLHFQNNVHLQLEKRKDPNFINFILPFIIPNPIFPATLLFNKKHESLSDFYAGDLEVIRTFNLCKLGITNKKPSAKNFKDLSYIKIFSHF